MDSCVFRLFLRPRLWLGIVYPHHIVLGPLSTASALCSRPPPCLRAAQERSLQEGVRARRPLLCRRGRDHLWCAPSFLPAPCIRRAHLCLCTCFRPIFVSHARISVALPLHTVQRLRCHVVIFAPSHFDRSFLNAGSNLVSRVEERPGHHVKLYQYCSTDVQGMVQRHLRVRLTSPPIRSTALFPLPARLTAPLHGIMLTITPSFRSLMAKKTPAHPLTSRTPRTRSHQKRTTRVTTTTALAPVARKRTARVS